MAEFVRLIRFATSGEGHRFGVVETGRSDLGRQIAQSVTDLPFGILIQDCRGTEDLQRCDVALAVAEASAGLEGGITRIAAGVASASGLALAVGMADRSSRLVALGWSRQAFCQSIGCDPGSGVAQHARVELLLAARAIGVAAYDDPDATMPWPAFAAQSASMGFDGYILRS